MDWVVGSEDQCSFRLSVLRYEDKVIHIYCGGGLIGCSDLSREHMPFYGLHWLELGGHDRGCASSGGALSGWSIDCSLDER
jgi:hypothetical protein